MDVTDLMPAVSAAAWNLTKCENGKDPFFIVQALYSKTSLYNNRKIDANKLF